jgi:aryl-alcohol dehydrogenase-like predicted oxidoreductase
LQLNLAIYNAIHRGIEPELIPVCRRFGIQIVVYNPLAGNYNLRSQLILGGFFSGKYHPDKPVTEGRFDQNSTFIPVYINLISVKAKDTEHVISTIVISTQLK